MSVYVGLDCGGSSSRVLAVDETGTIIFQGQSGAANLVSTPEARIKRNLTNATRGCARADFVCGCFAGLVGHDTKVQAEDLLRKIFPGSNVRAEPDYTAAVYSSPPATDVCVIAGTGSLVCSRSADGVVKSGGRGYILGDFGSGFHYGRDALVHYLDNPITCSAILRHTVLDVFGTDQESTIVSSLYKSGSAPQVLGRLARIVGIDASAGESYALASLERNTRALTDVVREHVARYLTPSHSLTVSLAGGMWKGSGIFRTRFQASLEEQIPDRAISVSRISKPPLYGALELAKELRVGY